MLPIGDDNSGRTIRPYINYLLIIINIVVFVLVQGIGTNEAFLMSFATVPEEILTNTDITSNGLGITPIPVYSTIFTAMFMHGGIAHIAGNMLYLWIFGDNLENAMGHSRYLIFYLLCGILATLCHVFLSGYTETGLLVPSLGASGAISGIMGGYIILFPKNRVRVFAFFNVFYVNALLALGIWIAMQIVSGLGALGHEGAGVTYAAHVGGFLAGMILVKTFAAGKRIKHDY
ncbi:MAG TPA: rhomboid family intramembrane serine protease [Niabella sp.]|nr:rhomboid family intramembrane serine protease [Niabella sp.]HOZ97211.1 rhomboid family intramembrane serine protease [Niabella sp.]HQW14211.1 rhomboid family intramembrane serine protease [Niabella sp.]HQX19611.1 rhomboid family intramembrane serine protease [Niabella sp.]HQX39955.1 rhomboid family intramembrane serine protease [Niabella sp.]